MKKYFILVFFLTLYYPTKTLSQTYSTPNGIEYIADFVFGDGTINLVDVGSYAARITITGTVTTSGRLFFPLPPGQDPNTCIYFYNGTAYPGTVHPGNNNNVYSYIWQPPGIISGIWSLNGPVPVELSSFTTEPTRFGVLCKWVTESEIENIGFLLERKTDDSDWIEIANYKTESNLLGQGTTCSQTHYEYLDADVIIGYTYQYRLVDIDYNSVMTTHDPVSITYETESELNSEMLNVLPAYPNPFNLSTTITYRLNANGFTTALIYDISGELINTLVNTHQNQGLYSHVWNGKNENGEYVPTGVYIYKAIFGDEIRTKKIMLLK